MVTQDGSSADRQARPTTGIDADAGSSECDREALRKAVYGLVSCDAEPGKVTIATVLDHKYALSHVRTKSGQLMPVEICKATSDLDAGAADCCQDRTFRDSVRRIGDRSAYASNNPDRPDNPPYDGTEVGTRWDAYFTKKSGNWFGRYVEYLGRELSSSMGTGTQSSAARSAVQDAECGLVAASEKSLKAFLARQVGPDVKIVAVVDEPETHLWRSTNRPLQTCDAAAMKPVVVSLQEALTSLKPAALDEVADPQHGITFFATKGAFEHPLCTHTQGTALGKECDRKKLTLMRQVLLIDLNRTLVDAVPRELPREALDRAGRWGSFYTTLDAANGAMRHTRWLLFNAADNLPEPQDAALAVAMRTGDCGFVSDLNWDFVRVLMRKGESGLRVIAVWLGEHWAGTDQSREGGQ